MSDEFFKTMMGRRYYEVTMPRLVDQAERLNNNLEAFVAELRRSSHCACPARSSAPPLAPNGDHDSTAEPQG